MSHPIVLGYDGSASSAAALDQAVDLVQCTADAEIVIVYCHEPPPGLSCELDPACPAAKELRDYERRVEREVEPMLHEAAEHIRAAGVRAEVLLAWEDPVHALMKVAAERGSHIIVVGSHGKGSLSGAIGRHTPSGLLHRSTVPVLVVPYRH